MRLVLRALQERGELRPARERLPCAHWPMGVVLR